MKLTRDEINEMKKIVIDLAYTSEPMRDNWCLICKIDISNNNHEHKNTCAWWRAVEFLHVLNKVDKRSNYE